MELPSNEAICSAVETGHLATAVSEYVGMKGVEAKRLVAVPFDFPARALRMIRHRERRASRAVTAMAELVKFKKKASTA